MKVEYAGFVISRENDVTVIRPDPKLLKNIREFPVPKSPKDIKQFQGVIGQIQCFMLQEFRVVARALEQNIRNSIHSTQILKCF